MQNVLADVEHNKLLRRSLNTINRERSGAEDATPASSVLVKIALC